MTTPTGQDNQRGQETCGCGHSWDEHEQESLLGGRCNPSTNNACPCPSFRPAPQQPPTQEQDDVKCRACRQTGGYHWDDCTARPAVSPAGQDSEEAFVDWYAKPRHLMSPRIAFLAGWDAARRTPRTARPDTTSG